MWDAEWRDLKHQSGLTTNDKMEQFNITLYNIYIISLYSWIIFIAITNKLAIVVVTTATKQ